MGRAVSWKVRGAGRLVALLCAGATTWGISPAPAAAATPVSAVSAQATHHDGSRWTVRTPFYREVVRRGDQDTSAYHIEHVRELQYRLRFAGVYRGPVTGFFGDLTHAAVQRYQRREHLRVTGVANHLTWEHLIMDSVRGRDKIVPGCKRDGWHACYDRYRHQVTLWHNGSLRNAWLVRGGMRGYETRVGRFSVYYRDKDHVSSLYGSRMPYSQFFSGGQAFHGSPYMTNPFRDHSHGCINMYIEDARQLWALTSTKHLAVHVYGAWD